MSAVEHTAENDALLRALRFAQARAVTERARGRSEEERAWLDMCALLEPSVFPPDLNDFQRATVAAFASMTPAQRRAAVNTPRARVIPPEALVAQDAINRTLGNLARVIPPAVTGERTS